MIAKNFLNDIEEMKNKTGLDLSIGADLSIALMNLISLEEHLMFSYMKTQDDKFLKFLEETRELRKKLLLKIVKKDDKDYSEKWCISKHLLSSSMRLTEVSTKYLHEGKKEEAEDMLIQAFNLYNMFWSVNGLEDNGLDVKHNKVGLSKVSHLFRKMIDCCKE